MIFKKLFNKIFEIRLQNLTNLNILFKFYKKLLGFVRRIPGTARRSRVGEAVQGHGYRYPVPYLMTRRGTGYLALRSGKIELSIRK